jgi:hypothetical protein
MISCNRPGRHVRGPNCSSSRRPRWAGFTSPRLCRYLTSGRLRCLGPEHERTRSVTGLFLRLCLIEADMIPKHAFAVPEHRRGGSYNYMTYTMFDQVFWRAIAGQINRFRKHVMGIDSTTFDRLEQHKGELSYAIRTQE